MTARKLMHIIASAGLLSILAIGLPGVAQAASAQQCTSWVPTNADGSDGWLEYRLCLEAWQVSNTSDDHLIRTFMQVRNAGAEWKSMYHPKVKANQYAKGCANMSLAPLAMVKCDTGFNVGSSKKAAIVGRGEFQVANDGGGTTILILNATLPY